MIIRMKMVAVSPERKEHKVLPRELAQAHIDFCAKNGSKWIPVGDGIRDESGIPEYYPEDMFTSEELDDRVFLVYKKESSSAEVVRAKRIYDKDMGWIWDDGFNVGFEASLWMITPRGTTMPECEEGVVTIVCNSIPDFIKDLDESIV